MTPEPTPELGRPVDIEVLPQPPLARRIHLTYVGVVAALCLSALLWNPVSSFLLIAAATAVRFALVRWATKRAYGAWLDQGGPLRKGGPGE